MRKRTGKERGIECPITGTRDYAPLLVLISPDDGSAWTSAELPAPLAGGAGAPPTRRRPATLRIAEHPLNAARRSNDLIIYVYTPAHYAAFRFGYAAVSQPLN